MKSWLPAVLVLSACTSELERTCRDLCAELVGTCGYAAFPDLDSCIQGCTNDAAAGADVVGQFTCVQEVDCDPFALIDCVHLYEVD